VGNRNASVGGHRHPSGNTGYHLYLNASRYQGRHLLTTASKHKGVAALQPHHDGIALGLINNELIDRFLAQRVTAPTLARVNDCGLGINHSQNRGTYQSIVDYNIGPFQQPLTPQRKQARIAWASPN
jgi:hypothetical protein